MLIGIKFAGIKVADGLIIDGHHRYLASLFAKLELEKTLSNTTSATTVTNWDLVEFVDEDWDTQAKIEMLNEQDANFNSLAIEKMVELLK